MARKLSMALLAVGLLLAAAMWRPDSAPPPGDSWLPRLAGGTFLAPGTWIDFRQRHELPSRSILPPTYLATVEGAWGGAESWGMWGLGERTEIRFFLRWMKPYDLYLTCRSAPHPEGRKQTVTVGVNGQRVAAIEVGSRWQKLRLEIPDGVLRRGDNRVELAYGFHLDAGQGDARELALAIEEIGLLPSASQPSAPAPGGFAVDAERDALTLDASGTYLVPARLPADALALELSVRAKGRDAGLRASILALDGSEQTVLSAQTVLKEGAGRRRLALESFRGREVFLVFDADLPFGGGITLRFPRLLRSAEADAPVSLPPDAPVKERPNIVMIILDAARADHFGVHDYRRDTTPRIDRLAAESLVFRNAVAECPYTACSMPNLLAGLSFWQHGLVTQGQRLAAEVRTLAEMLSGLGYQTLGFTGNPNSSRLTGSDQGFDEFYEIWNLAAGRDRTHPAFLTDRVIERLDRGFEDPFFLLLHYVPPHVPYDPDPRFDVFGDPDYSGPVTGEQSFARAVFAGEIELDEPDVAELVALYDGNLRMADHAVGRLLAALERLGYWQDTLLVLTSDHGEAFGEHGSWGHNSTIHEEMLRVPLILRLPRGEQRDIDLERLASLGDLVPTLLRRLGQPVPASLAGVDLLEPAGQAATPADRLLFLRSSEQQGAVFGVRTSRWKLMVWAPEVRGGWFRLFDLDQDPGETRDLAPERRLLQAALALRLERVLRRTAGEGRSEIPEAEAEVLRSLGYL